MSRLFYQTMQDNAGNLLFGVSGTMRLAGTGTLATIYGDEALTVILPNPMTNHPSFGTFKCFLGAGDYDFYMAKAGYTFETLTGVQGHGTMAQQDASNVAISGGSVTGVLVSSLQAHGAPTPTFLSEIGLGTGPVPGYSLTAQFQARFHSNVGIGVAPAYPFDVLGQAHFGSEVGLGTAPVAGKSLTAQFQAQFNAPVGVQGAPATNAALKVRWVHTDQYGIWLQPSDQDTGLAAIAFINLASAAVGSIMTTDTTTSYNTTSDGRLKTAVQTLVGELAVIRALRPVRFRWLADDSEGVGFLASEVQEHVQGVVSGEPDAVDAEGGIVPQQIDHSKLVPWLIGALQTVAGQVETLTERVQALEEGLGV